MKGNATVQMVQYSPETNQPITTLKSLKEPSDDDRSVQSQRYYGLPFVIPIFPFRLATLIKFMPFV